MKNTRKKMLLSSIAMLLVALIALGSATYAWYVANPNATATGLNMKTEAGKGLLVQSESEAGITGAKFTHDAILRAQAGSAGSEWSGRATKTEALSLEPASLIPAVGDNYNTGDAFARADAANASASAKTGDYTAVSDSSIGYNDKPVYEEYIALKVTGGADTADVSITQLTWTANDSYAPYATVRVAIVGVDGKVKAIYSKLHAAGNHVTDITNQTTASITPSAPLATEQTTKAGSLSVGNANKGGTNKIKVLVWVDGEDGECYSDNVDGSQILQSLNIKMKLTENLT